MRKYYSDFVRHCTRLYFDLEVSPSPIVERAKYNNYIAVSNVLDHYDAETVLFLKQAYSSDNFTKTVQAIAVKKGCKTEALWYTIQAYEKEVAIERGLL